MKAVLSNKIIISTRPKAMAISFQKQLEAYGAQVLHLPMIETVARELDIQESNDLQNLQNYQWVIFSSPAGVRYFFEHCKKLTISGQILSQLNFTAIGKATANTIEEFGYKAKYIDPDGYSAAYGMSLSRIIPDHASILFVKGELAKNDLSKIFNSNQTTSRINVYNTICPKNWDNNIVTQIIKGNYDLLFFASPSGFHNFKTLFADSVNLQELRIAAIGPTTAAAIRKAGITPTIVSKGPAVQTLIESFEQYFTSIETQQL